MKTTQIIASSYALAIAMLGSFGANAQSHAQGPYAVDVLIDGNPQPVYMSGGQGFVAGTYGAAYQIRVQNQSGRRIEAVVAVDGRDVLTGQPVNPGFHRGHIVSPWGAAVISGFRSGPSSIAAFRFTTVPNSYAWRTGTSWGIGTIRVWVFDEAVPEPIVVYPVLPYGDSDGVRSYGPPRPGYGRAAPAPSTSAEGYGGGGYAPAAPRDMGTEYGEQRYSQVQYTSFRRQSNQANAVLGIRYQSAEALMAAGILPGWREPAYPVYSDPVGWWDGRNGYPYAQPPSGYPY